MNMKKILVLLAFTLLFNCQDSKMKEEKILISSDFQNVPNWSRSIYEWLRECTWALDAKQIHCLAHTSLKSDLVTPWPPPKKKKKNTRFFGGSFFLLYLHLFLTKSFRRKYRISQIFWILSGKSLECISWTLTKKFHFFCDKKM